MSGGIVDSHLHVWDPASFRYPWLDSAPAMNRAFLLDDYRAVTAGADISAMVFVQCEAAPEEAQKEAEWVAALAREDNRIRGIVAWAPLEKGRAAAAELERLCALPGMRGIRRIIQFEADPNFCLQPGFIEGVRALRDFDLSFDICIDWLKMPQALALAKAAPDVPMVLDHFGKPPVADGAVEPWRGWFREFATLDNVTCKFSGLATEARHDAWTPAQFTPYFDAALEAFGPDRLMFGGDWPVASQAITYAQWVEIVQHALAPLSESERDKIWRGTANRFYRLGL